MPALTPVSSRILALVIGYVLGNFLTAAAVVRIARGQSVYEIGSGNPGMANVGAQLGVPYAALVLIGDIGKTALAAYLAWRLASPICGRIAILYAGVGATLGHNFPVWVRFRGGKGVATTCSAIAFFTPIAGILCDIAGWIVVGVTHSLPLGAVVIPGAYLVYCLITQGAEASILAGILTLLMYYRHWPGLVACFKGRREAKEPEDPAESQTESQA